MAENVADTWEDLEDSGELDRKLNNLVVKATKEEEENGKSPALGSIPWLKEESTGRTAYQPAVRILKRDPAAAVANAANVLPSKPIRTLQEREAAYAEARLRILGSAQTTEDEEQLADDGLGVLESGAARSSRSSATNCEMNEKNVASTIKESCSVVRQPRGPDGTAGFMVRQ